MKNKTKYVIAMAIFLIILLAGAASNVILTKAMIEVEHDQVEYQGLLLGEPWIEMRTFQPRQYIKVVPTKQINEID